MRAGIDPVDNPSQGECKFFVYKLVTEATGATRKLKNTPRNCLQCNSCCAAFQDFLTFFENSGPECKQILLKSKTELFAFNYER